MNRLPVVVAGISGAALMFLLDPDRGAARRARIRGQVARTANRLGRFGRSAAVDLTNRMHGAVRLLPRRGAAPVRDENEAVLLARIRSAMGRELSHPGAVHVMLDHGAIRLDGPLLEHEVDPLIDAVRRVAGARPIENRLIVHRTGAHVPGLQGEGTPPLRRIRHLLRSPAVRVLAATAVSAAATIAVVRR